MALSLDQLLDHPLLTLPLDWNKEGYKSYDDAVNRIGQSYLELLGLLDESAITGSAEYIGELDKKSLILVTEKVLEAVSRSLRFYLQEGNPYLATEALREAFVFKKDLPHAEQPNFCIGTYPLYPRQYRLRITNACDPWGIFHVPFEKRQWVESSRYSIPGHPTLYMSRSVLTAYSEMGSNPYEKTFVSEYRFTAKDHHSEYLVDMMNRPASDDLGDIYRYLARWPLVMACNIKANEPERPFKPEYVLPQMVFQWVKTKYKIGGRPIVGVLYPSTKVSKTDQHLLEYHANTAIPARNVSLTGHCPVLGSMFNWTAPYSFAELLKRQGLKEPVPARSGEFYEKYERYRLSDFGQIEEALEEIPFHTEHT